MTEIQFVTAIRELYDWVERQRDCMDRLPIEYPTRQEYHFGKGMVEAYNKVWNHLREVFPCISER